MQPGLIARSSEPAHHRCALPLYHVSPHHLRLLACAHGRVNILIPNPRDMKGTIKELARSTSISPAVNTLFNGSPTNPSSPS